MFVVKFVTKSRRKFFNFESIRRDLLLLLKSISWTKTLICVCKRRTYNFERIFVVLGNFHKDRIARK